MKLLKKEERKLLGRTEALAEVEFKGATPSLIELRKQASALLKAKENLIDVYKVTPIFGQNKIYAEIHAYEDENAYKEFRTITPVEKKAMAEAAKKAAEAAKAAADGSANAESSAE